MAMTAAPEQTIICVQPSDGSPDPCPACEHTGIVHPGPHNPTLTECQICLLRSFLLA